MKYTYNDILTYLPDLKKYVKSKIKDDWWKDIIQEVLLYLYIKFKSLIITDLKGLIINTAKMFINKHFRNTDRMIYKDIIVESSTTHQKHIFMTSGYNTDLIDDRLYNNIKSVSKLIFTPFKMQLDDDMSIKEIAQELNINENTVKTRIKRCKEHLKNGL